MTSRRGSSFRFAVLARFLAYFVITAAVVVGTFFYFVYLEERASRNADRAEVEARLSIAAETLGRDLSHVTSDAGVMSTSEIMRDYLSNPSDDNLRRLQLQFLTLIRHEQVYDQIRYLDETGMERIRINYNQGRPAPAPQDQLQDKSRRYYFRETMKLNEGEMYFSPLDLNVEHGRVEVPFKPMIRVASPVFDNFNHRRGIFVINYLAASLLRDFLDIMAVSPGQPMFLNEAGYWLSAPRKEDEFGFMFNNNRTFGNRYPRAWAYIRGREAGEFVTERGVFIFVTVKTLAAVDERYSWKLVVWMPPHDITGILHTGARRYQGILATLLVGSAFIALILAWLRTSNRFKRMAEGKLHEAEARIRVLMNAVAEGIFGMDLQGRCTFINPAGLQLLGYADASQLLDKDIHALIHHTLPGGSPCKIDQCRILRAAAENRGFRVSDEIFWRADGTPLEVEYSSQPVYHDDKVAGAVAVFTDVGESKLAERALRQSERMLAEAQRVAHVGNWVLDIPYKNLRWSDEVFRIFGYPPQSFTPNFELLFDAFHPDERAWILEAIDEAVRQVKPYELEHRVVRPDGDVRTVHALGEVILDAKGQPTQMIGTVQDITERKEAEDALRRSEERFRLITETIQDVFWMSTPGVQRIVYVSPAYERIWGRSRESLYRAPQSFLEEIHPEDRPRIVAGLPRHAEGFWEYEYRIIRPDGDVRWIHDRGYPIRGAQGQIVYMTGIASDITERKENEEKLRQAAAFFDNTNQAILITDAEGSIQRVNPAFVEITGYEIDEVLGKNPRFQQTGQQKPEFYQQMWVTLRQEGRWQGELWNRHKSGEVYPTWQTISAVKDSRGRVVNYVSVMSDISALKTAQERMAYLAHHDALTGLPNRLLFAANLDVALEHAKRHRQQVALMFLDLDRFKIINDTLGHGSGDQLLQATARRLKECVRGEDTVARLGGDEFTVILTEIANTDDVALLAEEIIGAVVHPVRLDGHEVITSTSIGVSIYPDDAQNGEDLLKAADVAMYRAKEQGRNTYRFYKAELTKRAFEVLSLEHGLRRALERQELRLYFQPQVSLKSGRIVGVEALLRWHHPTQGVIGPERFVELAEDTGLIEPIGEWVLRSACAQVRQWKAEGLPPVRLAVNLSGRQIMREGFLQRMEQILKESGVYPGELELELEITESLLQTAEKSIETLGQLKSLGVTLAIDDFGKGYSSLSHLKYLPVDTLKIDRDFVEGIPEDKNDEAIATAIIRMGHSLHLKIVGEGVETKEQLEFLRAQGCDEIQGYLFSKTLPAHDVGRLLAANVPLVTRH